MKTRFSKPQSFQIALNEGNIKVHFRTSKNKKYRYPNSISINGTNIYLDKKSRAFWQNLGEMNIIDFKEIRIFFKSDFVHI